MSFEERLINLVREYDYLYNTKSITYKNSTKRAVALDEISRNLNVPVKDYMQRWRSLRDRFSREHKQMSLPSGSAAVYNTDDKWEFYDYLVFLMPSLTTRKQIGNTENEAAVVVENSGVVPISSPPILSGNGVGGANANNECENDNVINPKKSRAIKRKVAEETFKTFMDGLNTTVAAHLNAPSSDVDMEFMVTMAKKMKPLPEAIKINLHTRILSIINEELLHFVNIDNN